jgi:hypothetical protein
MSERPRSSHPERPSWLGDVAWLAPMFTAFAFITTRTSLILHELVGHGAVAVALGATIVDFRLFLFGGGLIRYHRIEPFSLAESLLLSLGGIGLQIALGAALLGAARRLSGSWRALALSAALMNLLHAGFYLIVGTHYGFGDGRVLAGWLGGGRPLAVGAAALVLVTGGFLLARRLARHVGAWVRRPRPIGTLLVLVAAAGAAGGVHGAAMLAEQALARDTRYAKVMQHDSERAVERELAELQRRKALTDAEIAAARDALTEQHQPFPLRPVLVTLLGASVLLGAYRGAGEAVRQARPSRDSRWALGAALAVAFSLVALLRVPWWRQ